MSDLNEATTVQFYDAEANDQACVIVRRCGTKVALAVSLRTNGDVETFLDLGDALLIADALAKAARTSA